MKEYTKDTILLGMALYACIGIFGAFFIAIWEIPQPGFPWISVIVFFSGCGMAIVNKIYEEMVETPKIRQHVSGLPDEARKMFDKKYGGI